MKTVVGAGRSGETGFRNPPRYYEPLFRLPDLPGLEFVPWHNPTTMGKAIWVGTIEISYLDHDDSDNRKNAFTVVTTWASSAEEFSQKCDRMFESYGWKLLGIEKANPAPENYDYNDEVADQLERTRLNPNAIIYGTFYTYPVM